MSDSRDEQDQQPDGDEQEPGPQTTQTPNPDVKGGLLANDHDVDKLSEDIGKLLNGLLQRGVMIDINRMDLNNLKARVEAIAACRILVNKGICTEAEMAAACNTEFRAILIAVLQIVEEQRLASQPPREDKIVTPQDAGKITVARPKLAVVRH